MKLSSSAVSSLAFQIVIFQIVIVSFVSAFSVVCSLLSDLFSKLKLYPSSLGLV